MKDISYYENMGVDYNNSGAVALVSIIDAIEKFVKNIGHRTK